jgi:argininosuccinate lyase
MKLWEKGVIPDPSVIEFTSGRDRTTDLCLAEWDIAGSMAHAIMLREAGLITDTEKEGLLKTLYSLFEKVKERKYVIEDGVEDIHSQVEKDLTRALGDSGKKIHTGRSRNDQVLVDIRLYTRKEIDALASNVSRLFKKFQVLSELHKEEMMPGYTHMQPAMASSFGLWFGSYAECLADDILSLSAARAFNDRNPLGAGAGYGSNAFEQETYHAFLSSTVYCSTCVCKFSWAKQSCNCFSNGFNSSDSFCAFQWMYVFYDSRIPVY